MADLDAFETRAPGDWEALFWWRGDTARPDPREVLRQRLLALVEQSDALPLPGNRLQANREVRRIAASASAVAPTLAPGVGIAFLATIRRERRKAGIAVATGLIATTASAAAAVYAAGSLETIALVFALAGLCSASFALYHAMRWLLVMRSGEIARLVA